MLSVFLVILALYLNSMLKKPDPGPAVDPNAVPVGQPAAVYVPQHVQLVAPIPAGATAAQVASGLAAAYLTFDTTTQSLDQHIATFPHPGPALVTAMTQSLTPQWTTWAAQGTVSKLIGNPSVTLVSSDPTGAVMDVTTTAAVSSGAGYSPASNHELHVKLIQMNGQWLVVDVSEVVGH